MFETTSKPYLAWQDYGKMVNAAKPKGLVVVSAHWEDEAGSSAVTGKLMANIRWQTADEKSM
jgi:4,5-DOPA dioxygenase extradiol